MRQLLKLLDYCFLSPINLLSCMDNSVCTSCSDVLLVTFRKSVYMCTISMFSHAVPVLEIPCHAQYAPSSICMCQSLFLSLSHNHPPPPLPPSPSCHPVKVIAIYRVGLICQSHAGHIVHGHSRGTGWGIQC